MKHFFLKSTLALLLLVLGVGQASAQSVTFTHNSYRGRQSNEKTVWIYYNMLDLTSGSDWIKYGNSWSSNGAVTSIGRYVIQRYNTGTWAGELFDWITMSYTAPSYSKATYTLNVVVEASRSNDSNKTSRVRAVYYDYGTNYSYWNSRSQTPDGKAYFRTAVDVQNNNWTLTDYGEKIAANVCYDGTYTKGGQVLIPVTVDNSTGSSTVTSNRYGGFLSTKTQTTSGGTYAHYSKLYMWYTNYTVTYYKHVTFNANGGTGTMNKQVVAASANLTANAFTRQGFKFAGWNTKADGTGTKYNDKASISADANSKGPVTLYAQWTADPITATFDYTYRTSERTGVETYEHMPETVQSGENPFTKMVRVNLRDASGKILKSLTMQAGDIVTPSANPSADMSTHKKASAILTVKKGTSESVDIIGNSYTYTLDATTYTNYRSVDFEVLKADASGNAAHWVSTKQSATSYLFKYEGHESSNMFYLTWTVNLKGLSMYPEDIFVKPMRKGTHTDSGGSTELVQIPAMQNSNGIECKFAGNIYEGDKIVGAYYTGEYKVLKTCAHGKNYNYQIGLTGFILNGITYYLAENEGEIPNDMISSAEASSTNANITFDRLNTDIPVLLLDPNVYANFQLPEEKRATINGQIYQLYVDNHATRTVNLAQFEAVRPGYTFTGWKDTYDNTEYAYNGDYHFNMGTKATTTLLAQWERTNAPVIIGDDMIENENNFIYKVKVWDELNELQSVQYIYTDMDEKPAANVQGWAAMKADGDSIYSVTIPLLNNHHGQYLWAKASNVDKDSIIDLGEIRSIFRLTANANPDSHVSEQIENGHTEIQNIGGKDTSVYVLDGTFTDYHYYDYYSTFFFSGRTFTVNNASVYTAQLNGNQLDLTEIVPSAEKGHVVVPAGHAVILRKNLATDGVIELQEYDDAEAGDIEVGNDNILEGVDASTAPTSGYTYYVLSYAQSGLGFYINLNRDLLAHKAYFKTPEPPATAPRAFIFNFGNGNDPIATAIENTEAESLLNGPVYNIYGQMVAPSLDQAENLVNGIYVVNGKKVVINK